MLFLEICVIGKVRLKTDIFAEGKVNDQQKAKAKGNFETAYVMKYTAYGEQFCRTIPILELGTHGGKLPALHSD